MPRSGFRARYCQSKNDSGASTCFSCDSTGTTLKGGSPMLANTSVRGLVKAGLGQPTDTGHAHFLERALSRRTFVRGSALAAALALAPPAVVLADSAKKRDPNPIPGGT